MTHLTIEQCMDLVCFSQEYSRDPEVIEFIHPDGGGKLLLRLENDGRNLLMGQIMSHTRRMDIRDMRFGQIGGWDGGCRLVDGGSPAAGGFNGGAKNLPCRAGDGKVGRRAAGWGYPRDGRAAWERSFVLSLEVRLLKRVGMLLLNLAVLVLALMDWVKGEGAGDE